MDFYEPMMTNEDLKALCAEAELMEQTPIKRARYAIDKIEYLKTNLKPKKLTLKEIRMLRLAKKSSGIK